MRSFELVQCYFTVGNKLIQDLLTDLLGGQVQVVFALHDPVRQAGTLRALGLSSGTRQVALPDLPLIADFLPNYEASAWGGIGAPAYTPVEIIGTLNREINAGLADPKIKAQLSALGATALAGSPSDFGKFIADETEKWGRVIKFANIKPE